MKQKKDRHKESKRDKKNIQKDAKIRKNKETNKE
jgi:hypothetical protein